ncbi:MAG: hypothetical protein ACOCWM_00505 [Cyclobacteriaceae bacterium]
MKKHIVFIAIIIVGFFFSCSKEESEEPAPQVNEDGLTQEITDLIPQSIIDEMKSLGMPIYGGNNPPGVEMTYVLSPFVLVESNRPDDFSPGSIFADIEVKIYDQNNKDLLTKLEYTTGTESGIGLNSFIVGNSNNFSVFSEVKLTKNSKNAQAVYVFSGTLDKENQVVRNAYAANFMLDNNGDDAFFIKDGEGRVFKDDDEESSIIDFDEGRLFKDNNNINSPAVPGASMTKVPK